MCSILSLRKKKFVRGSCFKTSKLCFIRFLRFIKKHFVKHFGLVITCWSSSTHVLIFAKTKTTLHLRTSMISSNTNLLNAYQNICSGASNNFFKLLLSKGSRLLLPRCAFLPICMYSRLTRCCPTVHRWLSVLRIYNISSSRVDNRQKKDMSALFQWQTFILISAHT